MVGVRAAPHAHWLIQLVADQGVRTATGDHSRRLIGQMLGRIYYFRLQRDLVPNVLTVLDFADFPGSEGKSEAKRS